MTIWSDGDLPANPLSGAPSISDDAGPGIGKPGVNRQLQGTQQAAKTASTIMSTRAVGMRRRRSNK